MPESREIHKDFFIVDQPNSDKLSAFSEFSISSDNDELPNNLIELTKQRVSLKKDFPGLNSEDKLFALNIKNRFGVVILSKETVNFWFRFLNKKIKELAKQLDYFLYKDLVVYLKAAKKSGIDILNFEVEFKKITLILIKKTIIELKQRPCFSLYEILVELLRQAKELGLDLSNFEEPETELKTLVYRTELKRILKIIKSKNSLVLIKYFVIYLNQAKDLQIPVADLETEFLKIKERVYSDYLE